MFTLPRSNFFADADHAQQRLRDGHDGFLVARLHLVETHGVDARHDVAAQVGRFHAARLQLRDDPLHLGIYLLQARGIGRAFAQRNRQRPWWSAYLPS